MEADGEGVLAGIRQKARVEDQAYRIKKRSLARDARRCNLEDVAKNLKVPTVLEVTALCNQLKKHKNLETLHRLRLGLSAGPESVTAFMECEGALYALVGCLTGNDGNLQREAACTLVNIGFGTEAQCLEVCHRSGIYLIMHMTNNNPQLQDPCAWSVGNLCGMHPSVCKLLHTQGIEQTLLQLLDSHSPHVLQSTAYALLHYLTTVPERIRDVAGPDTVHKLLKVLERVNDDGQTELGWVLFALSTQPEVCPILVDKGIIQAVFPTLEQLLNQQNLNISATTALVRCLLNCVGAVPSCAVQVCYRSEQLVSVTKALLYCPHSHLRMETLHLLANVINAASADSVTGECIVHDLSLRPRLESAVRSALAARFVGSTPDNFSFHGNVM